MSIAKNYLNEAEMGNLNEIVTMYLDYAERQARRGNIWKPEESIVYEPAISAVIFN